MIDVDLLNAGYASELLEQYLENPESVPPEWRALFEQGGGDLEPSRARPVSSGCARPRTERPRGGSPRGRAAPRRRRPTSSCSAASPRRWRW